MKLSWFICLSILLSAQLGLAKRADHSKANKKAAQEYCQLYMETFSGKKCVVDKRVCPKGYVADKKFKGRGTNYSACVNGKKMSRLKGFGTRELNRGDVELVNTKGCGADQIKALNRAIGFARDHWSSIKKEAKSPSSGRTSYFQTAYSGSFKGKASGKVSASTKEWKRLKKVIDGVKSIQIECRSKSWCTKKGVFGLDGIKMNHVNVCVDTIIDRMSEGYLAGNIVHEMAHSARFPKSKLRKHNCGGKWASSCPRDDATHQIGRVVDYLYMNQKTQRSARSAAKRKRLAKPSCSLH